MWRPDLLVEGGVCRGVVAWDIQKGGLTIFQARATLLATGGAGRMYDITSNALAGTGDGQALVYRRGLPLEDMEFFQFHPTGIARMGILITEGARGEGGVLRNGAGEAFMERYSPTLKDLAPRDIVSRAIHRELMEGRGVGGRNYVTLDLTHLSPDLIHEKLPDITDFVETYLAIDPTKQPIPVQPTAHYAMGGIPTDLDGRVLAAADGTLVRGLWAAGECACVSVHGANRLGTNSLTDLVVFGRRAANSMRATLARPEAPPDLPRDTADRARERIDALLARTSGIRAVELREELRHTMSRDVAVERDAARLNDAVRVIARLQAAAH
ncbi:MAG: FAD-binding protein, partial [Chloroflexi bacterium]|nr:FAD-binding protein [Chloroflexota bacterium]